MCAYVFAYVSVYSSDHKYLTNSISLAVEVRDRSLGFRTAYHIPEHFRANKRESDMRYSCADVLEI